MLLPAAKSLQLGPTLCDPMDCSLSGFSVHGILQARTLEWVAVSFSNAWKWKVKVKSLSRVWLLATPWTVAHQAPPSMGFSGQQYWSGVPLPSLNQLIAGSYQLPKGLILSDDPFIIKLKGTLRKKKYHLINICCNLIWIVMVQFNVSSSIKNMTMVPLLNKTEKVWKQPLQSTIPIQ